MKRHNNANGGKGRRLHCGCGGIVGMVVQRFNQSHRETIRVTLISEKNQKTLVRVNPHKPIQEFLPIVHEETGLEISDFRLRLLKNPDEDVDYSKSLDFYGGVNELRLIDLRPPPPQEAEPAPIEKKKKSMFGRKTKKKEVQEVSHHATEKSPAVVVAPPKETVAAPPVAVVPPEASVHNAHHAKRRPAPPPPPGGKKEPAPPQQNGGQLLKPSAEAVSRAAHGVSKKRRAPAPPPAGGPPGAPYMVPLPEHAMEVTVNGTDHSGHHMEANYSAEVEGAPSISPPSSSGVPSPHVTPDSTLDRKRDEGVDAMATVDDIDVEFSLQDLDEALDSGGDNSAPNHLPPPPLSLGLDDEGEEIPPPPTFSPPPPPDVPPSPGAPREDVERLVQEGRLILSPGGGVVDVGEEGAVDSYSECSSALAGDQAAVEEGSIVSEVSLASNDQSQPPPPAVEDPESGEKVRCDSTTSTNEDEEEKTLEAQVEGVGQLELTTEEAADSKVDEDNSEQRAGRAALTKMMKLSLDEDSNDTTNYSPTTHEEDADSFLEEKSVSSLAVSVTREPVESGPDGLEKAKGLEDRKEEVDKKEEEKDVAVVAEASVSVNSAPSDHTVTEEDKKDEETEDAEKNVTPEKADGGSQQPTVEQLTEQYKQLQQQMAMLQQQLMLNPAAAPINPATGQAPVAPAVAYQAQQMQQMQQLMIQQQLLLQQQQQQQTMMSPTQGGYMMVPQPGGGMLMIPQMGIPAMPTMPVYGQMTPPQAVSVSSTDEHHVSQNQETPASSAPQSSDETDAAEHEVSSKPSASPESVPEETPVKTQTDAAPSGRRNVFADILKKKNTSKSAYVLSARRESEKHHDSKPVLPSSALRDGSAKGHVSVNVNTSHPESRTELSVGATSPGNQDSVVHTSLSPFSHVAPPHRGVVPSPPPLPQSASLTANTPPPSPEESNNNKAKTISLEADITAPSVSIDSKLPSVEASTTSTVHSKLPSPPASTVGDKVPPVTLPKPRVGPRPYRPASMYSRVSSTDSEPKSFSDHARKVTDLRSMFMAGK